MFRREMVAYEKGYRVIDGVLYGANNNVMTLSVRNKKKKEHYKDILYLRFKLVIGSRTDGTRKEKWVDVHRLVAYQKFGVMIYKKGLQVRHLDGNSLNNRDENIALGTPSDNAMDRAPEDRLAHAIVASAYKRKFNDAEVNQIRLYYQNTHSYKMTMEKFGIPSKGSLYHILNNEYMMDKKTKTDKVNERVQNVQQSI